MTTRIVVVDDSALARAILTKIVEADGDIRVVGEAANGFDAIRLISSLKPDLVTMDIDMPGPSGLETIERIMQTCPVPILVVTGERLGPGTDLGFQAIELGALDFMAKPAITDDSTTAAMRAQIRSLAAVPVFLHAPASEAPPPPLASDPPSRYDLVAIGSGTGGPKSLAAILGALPHDFASAIAIVQHVPDKFLDAFARYVRSLTSLRLVLVEAMPHEIMPGELVLPRNGDAHLFFPRRGVVVGSHGPPYAGHRPSATVLFRSVAETYGPEAIGVLLSGAGDDGVEGLEALRASSALTIAESPETALVSDMPAGAITRRAATRVMPAAMIADYLLASVGDASAKTTAPPSSEPLTNLPS